jgi:cell wall-associated NlpC family hydrolase
MRGQRALNRRSWAPEHLRLLAVAVVAIAAGTVLAAPPTAVADGQAIVNAAASQAGRPYCFGGGNENGPTHGAGDYGHGGCGGGTLGFDCTGLAIFAVFQGTGITGLPHDGEGNRWAAKGTAIMSKASLQPGDVIFFGGTFGNFEHAGIYAGNGMVWDAEDFNVPVQKHSLAWIENSLPFVGAVRFTGSPPGGGPPPPPPSDNGGSKITGVASGKCLDVVGAGTANGTAVQLYDCNESAQQHWVYWQGQLVVYGNYAKCLDADSNNGAANGTRLQIWDCNGGGNQQWLAGGDNSLRSAASGRCLDAVGGGNANGTPLQLYDCSGAPWQKWIGPPSPNGGDPIRSIGTGRCLDVTGAGISPGTRLQTWDCNGGAQQQWILDGTQLRVYANMCLDAVGGGTANGTQIQVWPCNGYPQQQWTWGADGTIRSIPSGRCLDVVGDGLANGTGLQLWDCSGADWQKFKRPAPPVTHTTDSTIAPTSRPSCVTPHLVHMTLKRANRALKRAHCRLGVIRRRAHKHPRRPLRVTRQSSRPGSGHPGNYEIAVQLH